MRRLPPPPSAIRTTRLDPSAETPSKFSYLAGMLRAEVGQAVVVQCLLLVVFLWQPIREGGYLAAADLLQWTGMFRVTRMDYQPENLLLYDTVGVIMPALYWNKIQLSQGQLPLWNPYNASGAPHLANYQSAVFSPFSLPFYLLDFRSALIVAPFIKLFCLGVFTYLFLRRIQVAHGAALVGMLAYTYAGYHIVWLLWPMSGVGVALPLALYCLEGGLQTSSQQPARRWLAHVGLSVALTVGLLAGHPETFFFVALLIGLYALVRLTQVATWRARASLAWGWGLAAGMALALSLGQLLPFFEYLTVSDVIVTRAFKPVYENLSAHYSALLAFPNLFGNPSQPYYDERAFDGSNFNQLVGHYPGLIVIFLSGLALISWPHHRHRLVAFFGGVATVWYIYAHNLWQVGTWLSSIAPVIKIPPATRSQEVWLFSLACLAALSLHLLTSHHLFPSIQRWHWAPWTVMSVASLAWASGLSLYFAWAVRSLRQFARTRPNTLVDTPLARAMMVEHVVYMALTLGLAILALLIYSWLARRPTEPSTGQVTLYVTLGLLVFAQTGWLFRHYNPSIEPYLFYPETPQLAEVERRIQGEMLLATDHVNIPTNVNLWFGIHQPINYDGLEVHRSATLIRRLMAIPTMSQIYEAEPYALRGLQALGVQYVASHLETPFPQAPELQLVWSSPPVNLFKVPNSLPRYFSVANARVAASDTEALALVAEPGLDLQQTVVLLNPTTLPGLANAVGPSTVQVIEDGPTHTRLRVQRDTPGWLVALKTYYPGWQASVNDRQVPIEVANYAFMAVPVTAGVSEVRLEYASGLVRVGLGVSAVAWLGLVIFTLGVWGRRREGAAV